MFAIVKTAGINKGFIRSLHRSFEQASLRQPACYYGLVNIGSMPMKKGKIYPDLVRLLDLQTEKRRNGQNVTGLELEELQILENEA